MIDVLIEQEHYEEALMLLEKETVEDPNYYRLVCYYALGRFAEACEAGKKAMQETNTRYYEVVALYLAALVADNQDDLALQIVDAELSVPYIPALYEETFQRTKKQILQRKKQMPEGSSPYDLLTDDELNEVLQNERQNDVLLVVIAQLQRRNIRSFFGVIRLILADKCIARYIKTVIFELLGEQGVQETFTMMTKEGAQYEISPSMLPPSMQPEIMESILKQIDQMDTQHIPMMNEYAEQLVALYIAEQYPIELAPEEKDYLAAAIYATALTLLSVECNLDQLALKQNLKAALLFAYYEEVLQLTSL